MVLKHEIELESKRMIHDFIITENHIIIPDLPMEFNPEKMALESKFIFQFDNKKKARYGVMKRNSKNSDEIIWFELPAHMVIHFINGWEEKNEAGEDIIVVWGC
jgi:carotenoid cleavage dioxygenase-like enzyme